MTQIMTDGAGFAENIAFASETGDPRTDRAYPFSTAKRLQSYIDQYRIESKPEVVSFRDLVPWIKVGERATHYIHPYPAKLLPQIAHFFLANNILCPKDGIVLDPFGGTGTVALEANLSGRTAFYADANPLARLIAAVKTRPIKIKEAEEEFRSVRIRYKKSRSQTPPPVVNINIWYERRILNRLCRLKAAIDDAAPGDIKEMLLVTFSRVARKVSNADPRLSVPVRMKNNQHGNVDAGDPVWLAFENQFSANIERLEKLMDIAPSLPRSYCVGEDARHLKEKGLWSKVKCRKLPNECVDLVITSPPYAGAQKYIRASSLNLNWLDLATPERLKPLENCSIGREHLPKALYTNFVPTDIESADRLLRLIHERNPLRAAIAATYLREMRSALTESVRVMKRGGYFVLVIGNNEICQQPFMSSQYLAKIADSLGLKLMLELIDDIRSRGLMTKRNKTASVITREWVLIFKKQ